MNSTSLKFVACLVVAWRFGPGADRRIHRRAQPEADMVSGGNQFVVAELLLGVWQARDDYSG